MTQDRRSFMKSAAFAGLAPVAGALAPAPGHAKSAEAGVPPLRPYLPTGFADFKHRCVADVFPRDHRYMWPETTFRDLPMEAGWIWGSLYDEEGNVHIVLRPVQTYVATVLAIFHNRGADACKIAMESMMGWRGPISIDKLDKGYRWKSADYGFLGTSSFTITLEDDRFAWFEKDLVDIQGKLVPMAMQYYDPMPKPMHGQAYVAQLIRAQGTVLGKKVEGWIGWDFEFLAPGQVYRTSPMSMRENEEGVALTWCEFANEYVDGSWEIGWCAVGLENWGFAAGFDSTGAAWSGQVLGAEFEFQPATDVGRFPKRYRVRVYNTTRGREEVYEWNAAPRTNLVDIPRVFPELATYLSCEGRMQRVGDTRKVKRSVGYPDFYSDAKRHAAYQAQWGAAR